MPKVSVIVPVYNVAPYLKECLDSIISQTLTDIEIIIVDDGSTDGSTDICRHYADFDSRIRLIIQENSGVAAARKKAAEYASAKHMAFVDADDSITLDLFERLMDSTKGYDLVTSGCMWGETRWFDRIEKGVYCTSEKMNYLLDNMICFGDTTERGIFGSMWAKVFRTDLAREVFCEINTDIVLSEDMEFLYLYILKCTSVVVTDICGYYHRMREGSAIHSVYPGYIRNISNIYDSLEPAFQKHPRRNTLVPQLQCWISQMFAAVNKWMGFAPNVGLLYYFNPFSAMLSGKRFALYGAGVVGQSYYLHMANREQHTPVIWVDQRYQDYQPSWPVYPVDALEWEEYDYLLIAVKDACVAESIKKELVARGISDIKILWKEPMSPVIYRQKRPSAVNELLER